MLKYYVAQNALLVLLGGDSGEGDVVRPAETKPVAATDNQDLLDLLGKTKLNCLFLNDFIYK